MNEKGEAAALDVHALPIAEEPEKGARVSAITPFTEKMKVKLLFAIPTNLGEADGYFTTISRLGMVKRSLLSDLPAPSANLVTLTRINEGDALCSVVFTKGNEDLILATRDGMGIRFNEEDVRPMGLIAAGVGGIKLREDDVVIGAGVASRKGEVLLVNNQGKAKRIAPDEFPVQGRYGYGVITWKLSKGEKVIGMMVGLLTHNGVLHFKEAASRLVHITDAPSCNRMQKGEKVVDIKKEDAILEMTAPLDMAYVLGL